MLYINPTTYDMTCPVGDTGQFTVTLRQPDGQPLTELIDGAAVFAVCKKRGTGYATIASIANNIVSNTATFMVSPEFSRAIEPGSLYWDVRVVIDPARDSSGNVITDNSNDEVHSMFAGRPNGLPKYNAAGVAVEIGGNE